MRNSSRQGCAMRRCARARSQRAAGAVAASDGAQRAGALHLGAYRSQQLVQPRRARRLQLAEQQRPALGPELEGARAARASAEQVQASLSAPRHARLRVRALHLHVVELGLRRRGGERSATAAPATGACARLYSVRELYEAVQIRGVVLDQHQLRLWRVELCAAGEAARGLAPVRRRGWRCATNGATPECAVRRPGQRGGEAVLRRRRRAGSQQRQVSGGWAHDRTTPQAHALVAARFLSTRQNGD